LIVITHGDFDHTGSAAELRRRFGAKIGMHTLDAGMAERADMFWNRKKGNRLLGWLIPVLFGFNRDCRFSPDVSLEDGCELGEYGVEEKVLHIPGHSKGSIGILTSEGDLFCGDLFSNTDKPRLNEIMDDPEGAAASLQKLKGYGIKTVYPGHGGAFAFEAILQTYLHNQTINVETGCPDED
jgi:hydroxyacylglutathione hydrolase